ncbi:hypothetical protein BT96DRAFT_303606 [Gymnopus androsaceus JB14]|uniref:Uncharacterized protein n=1 Tax=Gymnopus androsaceus JB14 TaxID=1447944 RepID=A0A6A4H0G5_9AGAR|nr:hypothetical protein BT96DRAFT_303606 [Gymnopus androsaceus JB14]
MARDSSKILENNHETDILPSPFQQLPNEIICPIFESACTDNLLQQYPWPVREEPPTELSLPVIAYLPALAISAVCTRWRFLALESPRLWSRFNLEIAPDSEEDLDVQSGFRLTLQLYLDRSADSPLHIDLQTPRALNEDEGKLSALLLFFNHTSRWQTFSYTGDFDLGSCEGFRRHPSFPILEALNLRGCQEVIKTTDLDCFEHAPELRAVRTDYFETGSHLPWTSLDVRGWGWKDLLRYCPGLTVLKLRDFWSTLEPSSISLASLESFTFVEERYEEEDKRLENMFSHFTFPSLGELIIYTERTYNTKLLWPMDSFTAFISRSSCTLTALSLSGVTISNLDFIATLRLLPSLTKLSFGDDVGTDNLSLPLESHSAWLRLRVWSYHSQLVLSFHTKSKIPHSMTRHSSRWFYLAGFRILHTQPPLELHQ